MPTDHLQAETPIHLIPALGCVFAVAVWFPTTGVADDPFAKWRAEYSKTIAPILDKACSECHRGEDANGFNLDTVGQPDLIANHLDTWDRVGKRVRLNEMPPEGSPGLNDNQKAKLHRWLDSRPEQDKCAKIANEETQSWYRGYVMSRRFTRTEYLNAINELVGIPSSIQLQIPSDGAGGEGFDTSGDALFTSTLHIEQYIAASDQLLRHALLQSDALKQSEDTESDDKGNHTSRLASHLLARVQNTADISPAIQGFARRAWRRPVTPDEVDRLMRLAHSALDRSASPRVATAKAFQGVLVSPNFLFVVETESEIGGVQVLTPHQLATRLALFVWSSIPDEELLQAADSNELQADDQIIAQVRRMIADGRSRALGENFGLQWLGLSQFTESVQPDAERFPDFDDALASDMREEAVQVVWNVFRNNASLLELIDAQSVPINQRLAKHYGLPKPAEDWEPVPLPDRRRGGVLTLGAVLTSTSHARRTSPVLRGRWVLEEVLGSPVPPPPPGVPPLSDGEAEQAATLREQLELHRKDPKCAACHNRMDPIGFGLENFDAIGRWRDQDASQPIDSNGKLPSGETFSGPAELKQVVLKQQWEFKKHFVRKVVGFAFGRELNSFDDCVIEDSLKNLGEHENRSLALIETIVTSFPFRHRFFKPKSNP